MRRGLSKTPDEWELEVIVLPPFDGGSCDDFVKMPNLAELKKQDGKGMFSL